MKRREALDQETPPSPTGGDYAPSVAARIDLAQKAGGKFPFYETMRYIDGRESVRAHGYPDMPVWGEIFRAEAGAGPNASAEALGKLVLITDYIRIIQQEP